MRPSIISKLTVATRRYHHIQLRLFSKKMDSEPSPPIPSTSTTSHSSSQSYDSTNPLHGFADFNLSSESDSESPPSKPSEFAQRKQKNVENIKLWKDVTNFGATKVAYPSPKPKIIRSRNLTDATAVFQCNAWDDVEWDEEMKNKAEEMVSEHVKTKMGSEKRDKLETKAWSYWDEFYGVHKNKFFRDRNWLFSEFPELESPFGCSVQPEEAAAALMDLRSKESYPGQNSKFKVLEVGCGVGNTVFPLLASNNNPHTYVYCCDFSPQAIEIIKQTPQFESSRCTPFVLDLTEESPNTPFPPNSIDVVTAIFVVSAITPAKFKQVIESLYTFVKPGGLVLFRDYGRYDLAQLRFKDGRCIEDNFYMRGDGTRVYFFTEQEVEELFIQQGFEKETLLVDRRLQVNRGKQLKMYRVWVQGKFRKPLVSKDT